MTPTQTTAAGPRAADRFTPIQSIAMAVLLTANLTLAIDFSILTVALPHIGRELGFATAALPWIVTSFALCAAGFTLFFGRVADLFGRRRLFLAGMVLLGASSLLGGLAAGPVLLIAARIGQGLATAMVTPAALALMTTMFPEGPARSRALGLNGALMAAGFTAGAVLGGLLTGAVSWRWAFFLNVAVALLAVLVGPRVLHEPERAPRTRVDAAGAVTVTATLLALVLGVDLAGRSGWDDPAAAGLILLALVLGAVFVLVETRAAAPLVDLALLRRRTVAGGNLAGLLAFATETALVFLLTLHLQEILGFSAVAAGLILGVLGLGTVIGGLLAPRVICRIGAPATIVLGLLTQGAATAPLALLPASRGWLAALVLLAFLGGAANLVAIVGSVVTATSAVPGSQQGLATGLVTMNQQVGIALGTPVLAAVATAVAATSLLGGLRLAIGVDALLCLLAAVLAAVLLRRAPRD
ncbi:MFS transporter [Brachybacterium phenoliresistens]|uniref:MFS transporter n=1 Tax=Brachybacterium phenoliresistens TaxID=396014 RepID=Z9JP35_9MICO|nr:MFS transporter [Brachybacterium phenoliresistens]EWS80180.1 MFS transporter [Brachybacterium phenoliresistens]